jgi:hypothetical protein
MDEEWEYYEVYGEVRRLVERGGQTEAGLWFTFPYLLLLLSDCLHRLSRLQMDCPIVSLFPCLYEFSILNNSPVHSCSIVHGDLTGVCDIFQNYFRFRANYS